MKEIELSPKQIKSLKLFSYYVKSHGCKEASLDAYFYNGGDVDNGYFDRWFCRGSHSEIVGYDAINEIVEYIVEKSDFVDDLEDYDNSGSLDFVIDCDDNRLDVVLYENVRGSNDLSQVYDIEDEKENESLYEFFQEMKNDGITNGSVNFDGGGDSGEIYDKLETSDGSIDIPAGVEDWLYRTLEGFYGGWEINEGSHGTFEFDFENGEIVLEFSEHTENNESRGKIFEVKF